MQALLFLIAVGILSGMAIGLQGPLASIITQKLGVFESVLIVHAGGVLVSLLPLMVLQRGGNLARWRELPWYVFAAGVFGLIVLASISYMIPRIGVSPAMMLIIIGQILVGALLDHYGLLGAAVRELSWPKLAGFSIMLLGAWVTLRS
jgi:transporter family-2 protein